MSHFITVPINENGIITDDGINDEIAIACDAPFRFTDIFIYSHGWWNSASRAMGEYNIFTIGFAKILQNLIAATPTVLPRIDASFSPLAIGLHWPSMISEDQDSVSNFLEATSFFTMQHRADEVGEHAGYSLLRLLIEGMQGRSSIRFHLVGHSFGCRVLSSALQALTTDAATLAKATAIGAQFDVALLQAAMDTDSLAPGQLYGAVLGGIPNLRLLVTTSHNDTALGTWYPRAQDLAHLFSGPTQAMGFVGPTGNLAALPVSDMFSVQTAPVQLQAGPFAVVNLTPLHTAHASVWGTTGGWGGQHSDINLPEIYELLARFFGN